jgi:hypothetical protein
MQYLSKPGCTPDSNRNFGNWKNWKTIWYTSESAQLHVHTVMWKRDKKMRKKGFILEFTESLRVGIGLRSAFGVRQLRAIRWCFPLSIIILMSLNSETSFHQKGFVRQARSLYPRVPSQDMDYCFLWPSKMSAFNTQTENATKTSQYIYYIPVPVC